ncbi:MAG TPA: FtsX-like permease family protein [Longimicrobiales bacterium]|nr:FtsX-like permease family protein [Longimicrobiales bacterium]
MEVGSNGVGPGYFDVMGIEFVRGRGFTEADRAGAPEVVVVNEAFARRYWPGRDAVGMRVGLNGPDMPLAEVIGVVPDGKYRSLTEEPTPFFYYPLLQRPMPVVTLSVRTAYDATAFAPSLRAELRALAPAMAVPSITTLRSHVGLATLPQRIATVMLAALGGLALLIAGVGLYGVVAYTVAQRTREFGIRSALGAASGDVQRMVVGHALRLAAIGAVVGVALAVAAAVVARSLLLVSPFDPVAIGGVVLVMAATTGLAAWGPARRAMRVDPLIALRSE